MGESFYTVLGVGADADADAIERAYRDRVKECHPDVSDTPDARERFKRLTVARDTLVDGDERFRYDTLGHERYVSEHVSSGLFESESPSGGGTETQPTDDADDEPAAQARRADESATAAEDESTATAGDTAGFDGASAAAGSVATDGGPREWAAGSTTVTGTAVDRSRGTPAGASDIYGSQSTVGRAESGRPSPLTAVSAALGTLGPWLVVYLSVVAAAAGTGWLVFGTGAVSSPLVAASLTVIVLIALAASVLHLVTTLA